MSILDKYKFLSSLKAIVDVNKENIIELDQRINNIGSSNGDMTKNVYDTNNNGIVDNSELLEGNNSEYLLNRSNHNGTQDIDTINRFSTNIDESTIDLTLNSNVTLQLGQEVVVLVRNNTQDDIADGTVVMVTGSLGNSGRITIAPSDGLFGNEKLVIGVTTETILAGEDGFVTVFGKIRGINTSNWNDGDILYVSPNDSGVLTNVVPQSNELKMSLAYVVNSSSNGTIFVRINPYNENEYYFKFLELSTNYIQTINSNSTLNLNIDTYFIDASNGNITLTLPSSLNQSGVQFNIKRIDNTNNKVNIITQNNELIDIYSEIILEKFNSIKLISNNINWFII